MGTVRLAAAALAALLLAACGYDDMALTPPNRGPAVQAAAPPTVAKTEDQRGEFGLGAPFVVIRFGPGPVDFEAPLADAIAEALAQRPNARFHLLAVTAVTASGGPQLGREPSLRHAEAVLRSLAAMGVPADEVFVAAVASPANLIDEVRLYLR
jgi:ABC-type amino acid transport substrate-binding protein